MEEIARQLGVSISFKARDAVMIDPRLQKDSSLLIRQSEESVIMFRNSAKLCEYDCNDDDDTASTVSITDDSSCSSSDDSLSSTGFSRVTFAEPLVTEVYLRPTTTLHEKHVLYYSDYDYREFRRDYFYRKRESLVQFDDKVVTDIWEIPTPEEKDALYYSESDLQGYVLRLQACICSVVCCSNLTAGYTFLTIYLSFTDFSTIL